MIFMITSWHSMTRSDILLCFGEPQTPFWFCKKCTLINLFVSNVRNYDLNICIVTFLAKIILMDPYNTQHWIKLTFYSVVDCWSFEKPGLTYSFAVMSYDNEIFLLIIWNWFNAKKKIENETSSHMCILSRKLLYPVSLFCWFWTSLSG